MEDKLLIQLIKIVKQSKQPVLSAFTTDLKRVYFVNFETILDDVQKHTKHLANTISKEAKTFNKNYENEENMIKAVKNSFENINLEVKSLVTIYKEIKANISRNNIQALLSLQIIKKILYDYVLWCEKLENALLGIVQDEVIFMPNIEIESEIISFFNENTEANVLNCWLPFLGGLGLGFLLDEG